MNNIHYIEAIHIVENEQLIESLFDIDTLDMYLESSQDYIVSGHKQDYLNWTENVGVIIFPDSWDGTDPRMPALMNMYGQIFYWMIKTNNDKLTWHSDFIGNMPE